MRRAFHPAFRPAFRRVFDPPGQSQSPLQQAVIAAWDMQEESGPLLPAKGDIEIPAFNAPGTTAGPAVGISARSLVRASNQYFGVASDPIFLAPESGVKVIRAWAKGPHGSGARPVFSKGRIGDNSTSEYSAGSTGNSADTNGFARNAANSSTATTAVVRPDDDWYRIALKLDADAGEIELSVYDLTAETEATDTAALADFRRASQAFRVGFDGAFSHFDGAISLVSIFNRALTTEERTADFTPRLFSQL